ncbi:MAG: hypothetical protein M1611_00060 [Candidatus Marsarchaeota archaeon]|jgi:hypothetical protein|nr:hypothetical protein [Candidatus Marsarchaeota archaeon]
MITGIEISKVEANRFLKDPIYNMKFGIGFDDVEVKNENVHVKFVFTTNYEPEPSAKKQDSSLVGELKVHGTIISRESKTDLEGIRQEWATKKTLPLKFAEDIVNVINMQCSAVGTLVAYSIGFAAPIPISRAKLEASATQKPAGAV